MGTFVRIDLAGHKQLAARLRRIRSKVHQRLKNHVNSTLLEAETAAKKNLSDPSMREGGGSYAAVDTGGYRASITHKRDPDGMGGEVGSSQQTGVFIEYGTSPGWGDKRPNRKPPPAKALEAWARRHGMTGAEFAIALKIAERGTPPHPHMRPAVKTAKPKFIRGLREIARTPGRGT